MFEIKTPQGRLRISYNSDLRDLIEKDEPSNNAVIQFHTRRLPSIEEAETTLKEYASEFNWKTPDYFQESGNLQNGTRYGKQGSMIYLLTKKGEVFSIPAHKVKSIDSTSYAAQRGNDLFFRMEVVEQGGQK